MPECHMPFEELAHRRMRQRRSADARPYRTWVSRWTALVLTPRNTSSGLDSRLTHSYADVTFLNSIDEYTLVRGRY